MINFEQYFKALTEATRVPKILDLGDDGAHVETHVRNKPEVVVGEHKFIKGYADVSYDPNAVLLGVCGNPSGWDSHEAQYRALGFNLNNVIICEMGKKEYFALLSNYLRNIIGLDAPTQVALKDLPPTFFTNKDIIKVFDKTRKVIIYVKAKDHPALMWGQLTDTNGIQPVIPADDKLAMVMGNYIQKTEHIDFDITSKTTNIQSIVTSNNNFYQSYTKLKSCVQVYEFKRGLQADSHAEAEADRIFTEYDIENFIRSLGLKDVERAIDGVWEGIYRINASQTRADQSSNNIKNALIQHNKDSLIQIYTGANGAGMISITTVPAQGEAAMGDITYVGFNPGESNAGYVRSVANHAQRQGNVALHAFLNNVFNAIHN